MFRIAWRNLRQHPLRLGILILGVGFAVLLLTVEVGLLLGLAHNAGHLIERSRAQLWVSKVDVQTFDFGTPFSRRARWLIESTPGVERVEELNLSYAMWRLPSGGNSSVQVVGLDLLGELAPVLPLSEGRLLDLHNRDTIIIDESERGKLGNPRLGDQVEIVDHRARIVGFTRGMVNFTTTPYVFTSLRRSHQYTWLTEGGRTVIYYLVRVAPGWEVEEVRGRIAGVSPEIEVHTREGFAWRTRRYWLFETGAGAGFVVAAVLGLLVAAVLVSQMLYALTVDKLQEYAVLKALGLGMGELARIVLGQGLICAAGGLLLGLAAGVCLAALAGQCGTRILLTGPLLVGEVLLVALLCAGASCASIWRLRHLDPVRVFAG